MANLPQPDSSQIDAAMITPTCTHLTTAEGVMYATGRVYSQMVEQAEANKQQIAAVQVAAIYDLGDEFYVQIDKADADEKNKSPVRLVRFPASQVTVGMVVDHKIKAACASLSRLHYKLWEEKWRALLDDEEEEFDISPEDLDEIPLEELQAAIARRKR